MSDRFDLEQQILQLWHVTDDLQLLYENVMDNDMSRDDIANALLGLKSIYNMKFAKCFSTFENMVEKEYANRA